MTSKYLIGESNADAGSRPAHLLSGRSNSGRATRFVTFVIGFVESRVAIWCREVW